METVINVEHVSKKFRLYSDRPLTLKERIVRGGKGDYREFYALKDVSFDIKRGSTVGLIGQNGSGKSTMLKIINRTMFPDEGKVTIKGKVASLIELGAGFHPELSGRENIYTNATIFGFTKEEITERVPDIIRFSELEEFIDNPIRTYSSGMYARLAFAVAIHVDADILLVDEILGVGDMNFQAKCANKIYEMKKSGTTILVVTHDMGTIDRLCDYGIWLDHGRKLDEGQPRYIQNRYLEFMAGEKEERAKTESESKTEASASVKNLKAKEDNEVQTRIPIESITEMGHHFGTGDIIFTSVKVLDERGVDKRSFQSDDNIKVVATYKTQVPVNSIMVNAGFEIRSQNGTLVYGTNTARDGSAALIVKEEGVLEIEIKKAALIEGVYTIGIAFANQEETIDYDQYHKIAEIKIFSVIRDIGEVRLEHNFVLDGILVEKGY